MFISRFKEALSGRLSHLSIVNFGTMSKVALFEWKKYKKLPLNLFSISGDLSENTNATAPIKKKIIRFNHNPFMSKVLRKAIMVRSKLKISTTNQNWRKLGQLWKTKKLLCKPTKEN